MLNRKTRLLSIFTVIIFLSGCYESDEKFINIKEVNCHANQEFIFWGKTKSYNVIITKISEKEDGKIFAKIEFNAALASLKQNSTIPNTWQPIEIYKNIVCKG